MKALNLIMILVLLTFNITASANLLQQKREETIKQYLTALKNADTKLMSSLFSQRGVIVSTSKGRANPNKFFSGFFSELKSADVNLSNLYQDNNNTNHYAAKFKFSWTEKTGALGGGVYMDDFTFAKGSDKLQKVYMFENKSEG